MLMTNGDHGTQQDGSFVEPDRKRFLDHFVRDGSSPRAGGDYAPSSVVTYLENLQGENDVPVSITNRTFPLENTRWQNLYLRADGKMTPAKPKKDEGASSYVSGIPRRSAWSYQAGHSPGAPVTTQNGPDGLEFATTPFKRSSALIGPATALLNLSSTSPDTELFVQIIDEAPDGTRYYVQRGLLKASHRALMRGLSDKTSDGRIYRPYRPHTNMEPIEPGKGYPYLVEIFPFGHVFRPGHRLIVLITTPPIVDSYYAYVPKRVPSINTISHNKEQPSSLMLPFVPLDGVRLKAAPEPCTLEDVRCTRG
jgi:putative CocE/NonD family hydrolase